MTDSVLKSFREAGRHLLIMGMNSSHSGNISSRAEDYIYITKTGTMLGNLSSRDIIKTGLNDELVDGVSMEYPVHRQVYIETSHSAVIHCHPPYAVSLSFGREEITPLDLEGKRLLGTVPVITSNAEVTTIVASRLAEGYKAVVVRGHGAFSAGDSIEKALHYITSLEMASKVISLSS